MRNSLYKTTITLFLVAVCFIVFSQDSDVPFKGTIAAGTDQWFTISITDQSSIKLKITTIEGNLITTPKMSEYHDGIEDKTKMLEMKVIGFCLFS